ncbi:hypothetical protein, partial [Cupriavidus sp. 8B]
MDAQLAGAGAPSSARSAALLLHALPEPDRHWLLQRLEPGESDALRPLLAELEEMGIPRDQVLLREVIGSQSYLAQPLTKTPAKAAPETFSKQGENDAESAIVARLKQADPAMLVAMLRHEPAGLIAWLLLLEDWPWRGALVAQLDASRRGQVEDAVGRLRNCDTHTKSALALRSSILVMLSRRLDRLALSEEWRVRQDKVQSLAATAASG